MRHSLLILLSALVLCAFNQAQAEVQNAQQDIAHNVPVGSLTTDECDITGGTNACPASSTAAISIPTYNGAKTDRGNAIVAIDVFNTCRWVDNYSNNSMFVPFRSSNEWNSFLAAAPNNNLQAIHCSRPYSPATWTVPLPPYPGCIGATTVNTPNIYARWSAASYATWPSGTPETLQFSCDGGATIVNASVVWNGLDADANYTQSWTPVASYGPDVILSASPSTVTVGTPTTLTWSSSSAVSCSAAWTGLNAVSGSQSVSPTAATSYSITCTAANGLTATATTSVAVDPAATVSLTASPNAIAGGSSSTLTWSVANASSCNADWAGSVSASGGSSGVAPTADTTYNITCVNALGVAVSASTTVTVTSSCIPTGQPVPAGQTACPTNECFFWVSGVPMGIINGGDWSRIGDSSYTWTTYDGYTAGSNGVGAGSYPDSYGSDVSPGPFYYAANGTFDGIAIGSKTRVTIYQGLSFSGPVLFDQHGPLLVNDLAYRNPFGAVDYSDWSSQGAIYQQFTPDTRFSSKDPMFGLSTAPDVGYYGSTLFASVATGGLDYEPFQLWGLSGLPNGRTITIDEGPDPTSGIEQYYSYQYGYGPTSVVVTCDP